MSGENIPIEEMFIPALKKVRYPGFDLDIMAMELVLEARLEKGKAIVHLRPVNAPQEVREQLEDAVAAEVGRLPGVEELELHLPEPPKAQAPAGPHPIEGVKAVVPVASGKGGVGKSTVAVNLALGLARKGLRVGLLDLDLYGPSIPLMLGIPGAQPEGEGEVIRPIAVHGIKTLSIGFMVEPSRALIWRGPLIVKAVTQLLHKTAWAPLDVLVLDLPPGTGDVQITMTQQVPVTGAVVVTTPQDVALLDAIKAVDMFRHTGADVLGVVENMSSFRCPDCGAVHNIFGHGSVQPLCAKLGVEYLGELPLDPVVRANADAGASLFQAAPESAEAYAALADKVAARIQQALRAGAAAS